MTPKDVERIYEAMAQQLDAVPAAQHDLYLAKLALLLAHDLDDPDLACQRVAEAAQDLDV